MEDVDMWDRLRRLWRNEEGQGLVEYSLIIALVAIAVVLALTALGGNIQNTFNNIIASL
ncbi:MAG: Flp family type IVb pilin [Nitrospinota bacterium]